MTQLKDVQTESVLAVNRYADSIIVFDLDADIGYFHSFLVYRCLCYTDSMTNKIPVPTRELATNIALNQSKYSRFYLTMLILSTIGTAFSLTSFISVADVVMYVDKAPVYSILLIISYINTLLAVFALVLLWINRNPKAIWLKLSTYVVTILVTIATFLFGGAALDDIIAQSLAENAKSTKPLDPALLESITMTIFNISYILVIVSSIAFGILWYFAWRSQKKFEQE